MQQVAAEQRDEATCMALAIYFEARGEPQKGQQAVGNVILNRTKSGRYPTTACGVLFQKGQFSFIRGSRPVTPKTASLWSNAVSLASSILTGTVADVSQGATSFCQRRLRKNGLAIGHHVFYG